MVQYIHGGGRKMGVRPYTEGRAEANARYDAKTYKQIAIKFRIDDDQDLLASLAAAQKRGLSNREWVRELFEGQKK